MYYLSKIKQACYPDYTLETGAVRRKPFLTQHSVGNGADFYKNEKGILKLNETKF